jgi:SAM-dependent MidA family methyltransferase
MLECRKHTLQAGSSQPLAIVEIGGGTGTLAASVLVSTSCLAVLLVGPNTALHVLWLAIQILALRVALL